MGRYPWKINDKIQLALPSKLPTPQPIPELISPGLKNPAKAFHAYREERCLVLVDSEDTVRQLTPDLQILRQIEYPAFVITAPGKEADFVSRTFYPHKTLFPEDPVTGASHCLLAPFWAQRLGKNLLTAVQVSPRG